MNLREKYVYLLLMMIFLFLTSCASYKTKFKKQHQQWDVYDSPSPLDVAYTLYFIGDCGLESTTDSTSIFRNLKNVLREQTASSGLVFLGDNIYPDGLVPKNHKSRSEAEDALNAHIEVIDQFSGRSIVIPGNHDWAHKGTSTVKRQEAYFDEQVGDNIFLPEHGCPGPEIIDLTEDIVMLVVDSQWYLEDWERSPTINDKCVVKNREDFIFTLRNAVRKYKDKYIVIAMHHPIRSYGRHAGHYPAKSHLFPLTDLQSSLYLPLPIVGTAVQMFRRNISKVQDLNHPLYKELRSRIESIVKDSKNVIFLSGHEHNQQLIERKDKYYIVSGSGSKNEEVKLGPDAIFASGQKGFGKLEFYDNGEVWVYFYEKDNGDLPTLAFKKRINLEIAEQADYFPEAFPVYETIGDSIVTSIYNTDQGKSSIYNNFFGEHYRDLYTMNIEVPVLDLFYFKEGLRPVKRGGGSQTNSLRLELPGGKQYVMRAIRKDASRLLPEGFRSPIVTRLLKDQFTSAHPFGAFIIPKLAESIGVLHTHPELYYIPKQPALGFFNEFHGNELYLFEERPDDDESDAKNFGYSPEVISTPDLLEELYRDKEARVDQRAVLRARLLDILINDWDRHDDQWRWARKPDDGEIEWYVPIPRDRDQAFGKFDGWINTFLTKTIPVFRQMRSFEATIPQVKDIAHNARFFDRSFMNELTWSDWKSEVAYIQEKITEKVIEEAVGVLPKQVYDKTGEDISSKLIQRVKELRRYASEYYHFLYETIDIPGTEEDDIYFVTQHENGTYQVTVKFNNQIRYDRIIDPHITKEVRLYGREGRDTFIVNATLNNGIKWYVLGGEDKDFYKVSEGKVIYDQFTVRDYLSHVQVTGRTDGIDYELTDNPLKNTYQRKSFQYDYSFIYPTLGFNPDDGLLLGFGYSCVNHAFDKRPLNSRHSLLGNIGLAANSFSFNYQGEFFEAIGRKDLIVKADIYSPQYVTNFFGFGNESLRDQDDINFYRVRNRFINLNLSMRKRLGQYAEFIYGVFGEMRKVDEEENKFFGTQENLTDFYTNQTFGGFKMNFSFSNIDDPLIPSTGVIFNVEGIGRRRFSQSQQRAFILSSDFTFIEELLDQRRLILAGRVGASHLWGKVDLYNNVVLGGNNEIRGYRNNRFLGGSSFYFNVDLRSSWGKVRMMGVPFTIGGLVSYDQGKVYLEGEDSQVWHRAYGGGLWFSPFNLLNITTALMHTREEQRFTLGVGFFF